VSVDFEAENNGLSESGRALTMEEAGDGPGDEIGDEVLEEAVPFRRVDLLLVLSHIELAI
jgi:hypothetical protein